MAGKRKDVSHKEGDEESVRESERGARTTLEMLRMWRQWNRRAIEVTS